MRTSHRRLPSRPVRCPSPSQWRALATEDPSCALTQDHRRSSNSASSVTTFPSPERCCPADIPAFVPSAFVSTTLTALSVPPIRRSNSLRMFTAKLERCPMCRSPITSYFSIRSEEYLPPNFIEQRSNKSKGSAHWLDALNDRLTDFLGFR